MKISSKERTKQFRKAIGVPTGPIIISFTLKNKSTITLHPNSFNVVPDLNITNNSISAFKSSDELIFTYKDNDLVKLKVGDVFRLKCKNENLTEQNFNAVFTFHNFTANCEDEITIYGKTFPHRVSFQASDIISTTIDNNFIINNKIDNSDLNNEELPF